MASLLGSIVLAAFAAWYIARLAYQYQLRKMQMKLCLHQVLEVVLAFRISKGYWPLSAAALVHDMRVDRIKNLSSGESMRIVDVSDRQAELRDCIGFDRSIELDANRPWRIGLSAFDRTGAVVERIEIGVRDEVVPTRSVIKTTLEVAAVQA